MKHFEYHIIAASLATVFQDFENSTKKSNIFRNILPDDTNVYQFARQIELISVLEEIWMLPVKIPVDEVVATEANLKPSVMRRDSLLFRIATRCFQRE